MPADTATKSRFGARMNQRRALRLLLAKSRTGEPATFSETWDACPFRTLLGRSAPPGCQDHTQIAIALAEGVAIAVALLEATPFSIDAETMADIQRDLRDGRTVLLLATHREVRDHARQQILGWASPAAGHA